MEAYKPYIDYLLNGGVIECAYIMNLQRCMLLTCPSNNSHIMSSKLKVRKNPNIMEKIVVYERNNLLDALGNKGVTKAKGGVRICKSEILHHSFVMLTHYQDFSI